jgi:hypothetical protein
MNMGIPAARWLLVALLVASQAWAAPQLELTKASFLDIDSNLRSAQGHPNERERFIGLKAYKSRRYVEAIEHFQRAASFADKYSQHYLSLIYWYGEGVERDPVRAYIWSDLAAERGSRRLLAIREKMWAELDESQKKRVEIEGLGYYDLYGDVVAKPKAEREIRLFATKMTGSRVGFQQKLDIQNGGPINGSFGNAGPAVLASAGAVSGSTNERDLYGDERTGLAAYWREQDKELNGGRVDIGPLQEARRP